MSCYYIRIRWDSTAVTGFLVPEMQNEEQALKLLKKCLYIRIWMNKQQAGDQFEHSEYSTYRLKAFIRTLKRPWRITKDRDRVVHIEKLQTPVFSNYWLTDIIVGQHLCNIHSTTWEPRPRV